MISEEWAHILLSLIGMCFIAGAFVWAIKSDTKVLATRLNIVDGRLDKIDMLLERLSDQKGRIDVIDERMLAQGKRVDEAIRMLAQVAMRYSPKEGNER